MERRKYPRFTTKDRTIALISPGLKESGYHVIDISKGGLAFRYLGEEEWAEKLDEIDIWYGDAVFIPDLPVKVASDSVISTSYITIRRLGVQFGELNYEQENLLQHFVTNFTESEI